LGTESVTLGVGVLLGPGINIKRTPLCGRNFEYLGEDPVHTGELAAEYVEGVQSRGVGTSLKHYAANNQEWGRHWYSSDVDERTLREIYLAAFERVVTRAQPWTVMCSYNRVNGVHAAQHRELLTDILRTEWGFTGVVVSDWGAVHDRIASLLAGLDLEMPGGDGSTDAAVAAAVAEGRVTLQELDQAVRRILELVAKAIPAQDSRIIRWGEVEGTPGAEGRAALATHDAGPIPEALGADPAPAPADAPALAPEVVAGHHALAREAAAGSVTLLRNDGTLPLTPRAARIAVVGAYAAEPRIQGAGSALVNPTIAPTVPVEAIRAHGPEVTYAAGFTLTDDTAVAELEREAVESVRAADVAVVCVGQGDGTESEGYDRASLDLPLAQVRVLEAAVATGVPVVVVVTSGSVVLLGDWHDDVAAVVHCPYAGQAGAEALADVLFGVVNPSGRLAETWPLRLADTPAFATYPGDRGHARYGEGVLVGYRWYDALDLPVRYPFGHGLSYTTFQYSDPFIEVTNAAAGRVRVACTVTNTGTVAGGEVVQVYVAPPVRPSGVPIVHGEPTEPHPITPVRRPRRELRDFTKVWLEPGEAVRVERELMGRAFAYWDVADCLWRRDAGTYRIEIGSSSRDLQACVEVDLTASPVDPAEAIDVELQARVIGLSAITGGRRGEECVPPERSGW
jgi:beta-glucosidase